MYFNLNYTLDSASQYAACMSGNPLRWINIVQVIGQRRHKPDHTAHKRWSDEYE